MAESIQANQRYERLKKLKSVVNEDISRIFSKKISQIENIMQWVGVIGVRDVGGI